jgi:hypothetical protein
MRQAFPQPPTDLRDDFDRRAQGAALNGARRGLELGFRQVTGGLDDLKKDLKLSGRVTPPEE